MLRFVLPREENRADVLSFYAETEACGGSCIGFANRRNYDAWLLEMQNRHSGKDLPAGYVRENFYLCYEQSRLVGVFSLKFELTPYLENYGGHIGYATRPSERGRGWGTLILRGGLSLAKELGFSKVLCVCDAENIASEKIILKNGGKWEDERYDPEENVTVRRYSIVL